MAHRTKIIRWTEALKINLIGVISGSTHTIARRLVEITRDLSARMINVDVAFGLRDDPVDEEILFMIGLADPDALPGPGAGLAGLAFWADWLKEQAWRSIGTDSGPIDVATNWESVDVKVDYANPDDGDGPMTVVATVFSSTTSNIFFRGTVTFEFAYRQHTYNDFDGNPTSSDEVQQWIMS